VQEQVVEPDEVEVEPCAHCEHGAYPEKEYNPGLQGHVVEPVDGALDPAGHCEQGERPVAE